MFRRYDLCGAWCRVYHGKGSEHATVALLMWPMPRQAWMVVCLMYVNVLNFSLRFYLPILRSGKNNMCPVPCYKPSACHFRE